ncbi:MAG: ester cyclase [Microcystaceae cyanobacterium]
MSEENKAIARRYYYDIMNRDDPNAFEEIIATDFVFINPTHTKPVYGPQGFYELVTMLHNAFPDIHFAIEDLTAEGDMVVSYWSCQGTHQGCLHTVLGNIPPSGKPFQISGMSRIHIREGKILEIRVSEDALGLLIQLGAIPTA